MLGSLNIFKLISNQFQSRLKTIWLGGTDINDEGNFEWNDSNKSLVKNGYQRWTIGQPDNFDNEDCMEMLKNGYWNDQNCNLQRGRNALCIKPISHFEWVPEQLSRFLTDPTIATLLEHPGQ